MLENCLEYHFCLKRAFYAHEYNYRKITKESSLENFWNKLKKMNYSILFINGLGIWYTNFKRSLCIKGLFIPITWMSTQLPRIWATPVYKHLCLYPGHRYMCLYPVHIYQSVTKSIRKWGTHERWNYHTVDFITNCHDTDDFLHEIRVISLCDVIS